MTNRNAEDVERVYHYAACHDCPLFKWVDSAAEAETACSKHHYERGHDATFGHVPSHIIEGTKAAPDVDYNE